MTLTDFLLARIADDEQAAREATDGPWWYDPTKINAVDRGEAVFAGNRGRSAITVASTGPADDWQSMVDAFHIALHDPARVLAECEAKRRIVAQAVSRPERIAGSAQARYAAKCLALPYADHPDYREEWKP